MKLSTVNKAYIAGFLDGDGSIYVRLKPNMDYKFCFQISPSVVFYQSNKEKKHLVELQKLIKKGYLRERKDGIVEYIIGDMDSISELLKNIMPYLRIKNKQAKLMMEILVKKKKVKSGRDFLSLAKIIDKFKELNYSKKRIQNSKEVEKVLKKEGLLTP